MQRGGSAAFEEAEFELAIHEEVEQGRPLSGARISEIYCGILKRYYGDAEGVTKIDPAYCIECQASFAPARRNGK